MLDYSVHISIGIRKPYLGKSLTVLRTLIKLTLCFIYRRFAAKLLRKVLSSHRGRNPASILLIPPLLSTKWSTLFHPYLRRLLNVIFPAISHLGYLPTTAVTFAMIQMKRKLANHHEIYIKILIATRGFQCCPPSLQRLSGTMS